MRLNPKQGRSSYKVSLISEAAIQLLDTPKSPDFTTNHIAERAGVSIGTLYRYFPNKGAILRHVVRREMKKNKSNALSVIEGSQARDAESFVKEVFEFAAGQFDGRGRVAFQIGSMVEDDRELQQEVRDLRLEVFRRLHEKLVTMQPSGQNALSDADLDSVTDVFFAAIRSIAASKGNEVDARMRTKLTLSLLDAFADKPTAKHVDRDF